MCPDGEHDPILDSTTGSEICNECGLVLNEQLYGDECVRRPPSSPPPTYLSEWKDDVVNVDVWRNVKVIDELRHVLDLIRQDSTYMLDRILSFVDTHYKGGEQQLNTRFGKSILAFAVWETLNQEKVPHSPNTIAALFDLRPNDIQRAERFVNTSTTYCPPSSYVNRLVADMGFPYQFINLVCDAVSIVDHFMSLPEGVIGAVLTEFQIQLKRQKGITVGCLGLSSVAARFGISPSTIVNTRARLLKECLSRIAENASVVDVNLLRRHDLI